MSACSLFLVIPAKAGIQLATLVAPLWTPACAGVMVGGN